MLIARDRLPPFLNGRVGQADKGPNAQRLPSKKTARMGDRAKLSASLGRRLCCLNFSLFVLPVTSRKSELQSDACAPGIKRPNRPPNGRPKGATLASTAGLGLRGLFFARRNRGESDIEPTVVSFPFLTSDSRTCGSYPNSSGCTVYGEG
jgi:hypothetical protein